MNEVRQLTTKQLDTLYLVYLYSYLTTKTLLISKYNISRRSISVHLNRLAKRQLLLRHYPKEYRLQGRSAEYYLSSNGYACLVGANRLETSKTSLNRLAQDRKLSPSYIDKSLNVLEIAGYLSSLSDVQIFAKRSLDAYDYFPDPKPDLFVVNKRVGTKRYFLDYLPSTQASSITRRRLKAYFDYVESGSWEVTNEVLPTILIITDTKLAQAQLTQVLERLNYRYDLGLECLVCTKSELLTGEMKGLNMKRRS